MQVQKEDSSVCISKLCYIICMMTVYCKLLRKQHTWILYTAVKQHESSWKFFKIMRIKDPLKNRTNKEKKRECHIKKKVKNTWQHISTESSCVLLKHFSPLQNPSLDATAYMLYALSIMHIFKLWKKLQLQTSWYTLSSGSTCQIDTVFSSASLLMERYDGW